MNEMDRRKACMEWLGMEREDRSAALLDARRKAATVTEARYLMFPDRHLKSRSWERKLAPRKPEAVQRDPHADMTPEEIQDLEAFISQHQIAQGMV